MAPKSYVNKQFGNAKENIENKAFSELPDKSGGFFGLVQNSTKRHYDLYSSKLRILSPFFIAELDKSTFRSIQSAASAIGDSRIKTYHGDIFKGLFSSYQTSPCNNVGGKTIYRLPLFSYGHLDFCCTAKGLSDAGFEANIRKLATWWNIKDTFRMDITVSKRADNEFSTLMLVNYVPKLFEISGWISRRTTTVDYCDTSAMRRVYYEFTRKRPWYKGRYHYIPNADGTKSIWYNGIKI